MPLCLRQVTKSLSPIREAKKCDCSVGSPTLRGIDMFRGLCHTHIPLPSLFLTLILEAKVITTREKGVFLMCVFLCFSVVGESKLADAGLATHDTFPQSKSIKGTPWLSPHCPCHFPPACRNFKKNPCQLCLSLCSFL